jgi:Uma2 family endonuclease
LLYDDLTLEQFLRLPEAKPALEFFDGNVTQKLAAKRSHSAIQTLLGAELHVFARAKGLGEVYVELRCNFGGSSIVPDLCFFDRSRVPREEDVSIPPDLVVEVISPGQTVKHLAARLEWCIDHGVRLGWLIHPRKQTVTVVREGAPNVTLVRVEGVLDGGDIIRGFEHPLSVLFDWLNPAKA